MAGSTKEAGAGLHVLSAGPLGNLFDSNAFEYHRHCALVHPYVCSVFASVEKKWMYLVATDFSVGKGAEVLVVIQH